MKDKKCKKMYTKHIFCEDTVFKKNKKGKCTCEMCACIF